MGDRGVTEAGKLFALVGVLVFLAAAAVGFLYPVTSGGFDCGSSFREDYSEMRAERIVSGVVATGEDTSLADRIEFSARVERAIAAEEDCDDRRRARRFGSGLGMAFGVGLILVGRSVSGSR